MGEIIFTQSHFTNAETETDGLRVPHAQGHPVGRWQSQMANPGLQTQSFDSTDPGWHQNPFPTLQVLREGSLHGKGL